MLRITPGHAELRHFATEQRLGQVAEELGAIVGRRLRVTLAADAPPAEAGGDATTESGSAASSGVDRRRAMGLPLVKRALEVFPNATLVDARPEADDTGEEDGDEPVEPPPAPPAPDDPGLFEDESH